MLWPSDGLNEVYDNIKVTASRGGCTVLIYVALDPDAICACRIITGMLKSDNISYKMVPVRWRGDIVVDYKERCQDQEIKTFIMLNCGGDMNVEDVFDMEESTFCYIIDSHRPFHHANLLKESDQAIVLGDEYMQENVLKLGAAQLAGLDDEDIETMFNNEEEEEDEDEDEDEDDDDDKEAEKDQVELEDEKEFGSDDEEEVKKQGESAVDEGTRDNLQGGDNQQDGLSHNKENEQSRENNLFSAEEQQALERELDETKKTGHVEADEPELSSRKRDLPGEQGLNEKEAKRMRVQSYYCGAFWGTPAAHIAYSLAQQKNKDTKGFLWLAIVGTTYHYLMNHLEGPHYHSLIMSYNQLVKNRTSSHSTIRAEDGTHIPIAHSENIEFVEETRLMLRRHSSLRDAFKYSEYVAAKLGLWRMNGEAKLNTLFAKMGISLKESSQTYSFMSIKVKHEWEDKISQWGTTFGFCDDFTYGSFQFRSGFNIQVSATDLVYIVLSLLDSKCIYANTMKIRENNSISEDADVEDNYIIGMDNPAAGDGENTSALDLEKVWQDSYNDAYDVLDIVDNVGSTGKGKELVQKGLEFTKSLQKLVMQEAGNIMLENRIQSAGDFRYCILENLPPKIMGSFSQPQVLLHLAQFLMYAHTSSGRWLNHAAKPLIIGLKSTVTETAHFVGIPCAKPNEIKRNSFGRIFREAARMINVQFKCSSFETSSVQLETVDVQKFLVAVHELMENS